MIERATILILAVLAGVGGSFLAQAPGSEAPVVRAPAQAPRPDPRFERLLSELDRRLARLERTETTEETVIEVSRPTGREEANDASSGPDPIADLLDCPLTHDRADALFQRLAVATSEIKGTIEQLLAAIRRDPDSADLFCALATAYSAKAAFDTPPGPLQGLVWAKAGRAYGQAIRLDPDHWQARYGKAFGESMAPEFLGLRPRAIQQFELLVQIQERQVPAPEHVLVYLRLGTLYKDAGNVALARETWERGRVRFPDDERLGEVLELIAQD